MPFFSIIIPTYNSGQTLQECLEGILCQSFIEFEILIMDGLSTDNTLEIAGSLHDGRIKIFSEKDAGIYDAMNKGVDRAKGEWLYFLGSDDRIYDKDVFDQIHQSIQNTKHKIIYGNVEITGNSGWAENGEIYDGQYDLTKLLSKNICHQAIFYHQSVFKKLGRYNITYKICADYDFNLKCYANYRFLYVDWVIAKFRGGNTSFSAFDFEYDYYKWRNITRYYKWQLYKKELRPFVKSVFHRNIVVKIPLLFHKFQSKLRINKQTK